MSPRRGQQLALFPTMASRAVVEAAPADEELKQLGAQLPAGLYLGTSSWSFPGWAGIIYDRPASSLQLARHGLAAYARHPVLRAVGIDRTYYAPLSAAELADYAAVVPPAFRFLVKAHEVCTVARFSSQPRYGAQRGTRNSLFLDARYATDEVVAPFVEGFGDRGGPLVFQFPPQDPRLLGGADRFAARLHEFLAALPRGPLYAVEIRGRELFTPGFVAAVADAGAAPCLTVHPTMPDVPTQAAQIDWSRAPALVVRWMLAGHLAYEQARRQYHPFDRLVDEDLGTRSALADLCVTATKSGRRTFVTINNKAEGSAPLSAFCLAQEIRRRMMQVLAVLVTLITLGGAAARGTPGPGPGQPFGGDDAGCVPSTHDLLACSARVTKGFRTLTKAVRKCHVRQADARYGEIVLGGPIAGSDEDCEVAASARFDRTLSRLGASGDCTGSAVLSTAAAQQSTLLADQTNPLSFDARNGSIYCDPSSAIPIAPGGDDAGFVSSTRDHLRCADKVAKGLSTLESKLLKCHAQAADRNFSLADPPFDEASCEASALAKYDSANTRLVAKADCPPCLSAPALQQLGVDVVARLDAANANVYPCPDDVLHPGVLRLDRPTLMALGVQLFVTGDADRDASVTVRYRPTGSPTWRDALPLYRVRPESVPTRFVADQFAGSIFDLRPSTSYEIELHAVDPDGAVDQTLTIGGTTRAVPTDPVAPMIRPVSDAAGLATALGNAQPGDVISLADGLYVGPFVLEASGTAANPIVIRGASEDATILDGGGCDDCNVLEVYGSFVHVERLTLRAANRALRFQTAAAEGNVMRRVRTTGTRLGIGSRRDQRDFYFCDNILEGPLVWPHVYTDDDGAFADVDGIHVEGDGHVVCHNQLIGFGDALKTAQDGARALDFYGNEVLSAYDNGIELDGSEGNTRALRNRFTNTYATISFQPIYGGPAYAIRNVVVNVTNEQLKFHGLGSGTGPSGVLVYQNTFVSPDLALYLSTNAASHHFALENNLFIGPSALTGTKTVDWLGPIDDGLFDYNGYFPEGVFRFNLPPAGLTSYPSFAAMQAGGREVNGTLLAPPIFASGLVAPASYTATLAPQDVSLAAGGSALERGRALPNVTDGFTGSAPDLGALERGCPTPIFGVRPLGIDESNEPLGCG